MITVFAIVFVLWSICGAAFYINAVVNWGRIFNPYKRILFGVLSGPIIWFIVVTYWAYDNYVDPLYVRCRNWFIKD